MICPVCETALTESLHSGLVVPSCPRCHGMWFTRVSLDKLENKAFHWQDHPKGTLVFSSTPTDRKCAQCRKPMQRFHYRMYDLELEYCPDQHGFWLDAGEDKRVQQLMRREESGVERSEAAEDHWANFVQYLHSAAFLDRMRGLFR